MNDHVAHTLDPTAVAEGPVRGLPCLQRLDRRAQAPPLRARCIQPGEPLGDVQRLRREVYFQEQGRDHPLRSRRISDGQDASGTVVVVEEGRQAVATLRVHDFGSPAVQVEYGSLFQIDRFAQTWPLERVAVCTRFAVQADQRVKPVVDALVQETWRHAHQQRVQFGLIACEPFLHSVFEHYGFREYLPPAVLPSGLALLRMVLVIDDATQLQEFESPLLPRVRDTTAANAARGWLLRRFPEKTML